MWLEKFLDTIRRVLPSNPLAGKEEALAQLDPEKIYKENVRSLLGVSEEEAERICETAVRQGLFSRGVEVLCPNGSAAAMADSEEELPPIVICWQEIDGHPEEAPLPTEQLRKVTFYRLNERRAANSYQAGAASLQRRAT
jgi:hypothetical protein